MPDAETVLEISHLLAEVTGMTQRPQERGRRRAGRSVEARHSSFSPDVPGLPSAEEFLILSSTARVHDIVEIPRSVASFWLWSYLTIRLFGFV